MFSYCQERANFIGSANKPCNTPARRTTPAPSSACSLTPAALLAMLRFRPEWNRFRHLYSLPGASLSQLCALLAATESSAAIPERSDEALRDGCKTGGVGG